jgi:predicted CXXCH cytochrome family protein
MEMIQTGSGICFSTAYVANELWFGNKKSKGENTMRNIALSKLQNLLFVLLMFALAGCGANSNIAGTYDSTPGKVTAKFDWAADGKSTAKTVASVPTGVTSIRLKVTGPYQIPGDTSSKSRYVVVKAGFPAANGAATVAVNSGTGLIVTAQALDANDVVLYEGFARGVTVNANATTDLGTISLAAPIFHAADVPCLGCHEDSRNTDGNSLVAAYKGSRHYNRAVDNSPSPSFNGKFYSGSNGCAGCHTQDHSDLNPAESGRCYNCHTAAGIPPGFAHVAADFEKLKTACNSCHNPHTTAFNKPQGVAGEAACTFCHSVGMNAGSSYVQDNNGVRAITTEFAKWSHHVTGVTLNDAHCAACHLEGKVSNGKVVVDSTKHMVDAKTHLRNADTDADFAWDPATPNHTGMDNYCMSCHDANGATSAMSVQIQAFINTNGLAAAGKTASASNPFGDTISNRYDKMQRPAVVDASSQFNTGNNSHHAVKGKRYSGRTRAAGPRQIASAATFAANSSAALQGVRSTIYDAGNFNALYSPLGTDGTAATGLGDDSTLHCGDCHTVGQWKVGSSDTANGSPTPAAIGAHGSNNEYLLRNTLGTDQRHTQNAFTMSATNVVTYTNPGGAFIVCYNCHSYTKYGSIYVGTGLGTPGAIGQPHAGEYDSAGRCNGVGNTLPFNGYTTGKATDGTQFTSRFMSLKNTTAAPYAGEQAPDFGNIFGIQCANCHNSGTGNAYGGIHGSANNQNTKTQTVDATVKGGAYIDGMGNTTKIQRFLPGLGNAMHVPGTLGGFTGGTVVPVNTATGPAYTYITGGISNDTNWEQKHWQQTATMVINPATKAITGLASAGAGCYTLGGATAAASKLSGPSVTGNGGAATELLDTWGGCEDHDAAQGKGDHGNVKQVVRPITY